MLLIRAAAGGVDFGDVDFAHLHHGLEGALGLGAAGGHRLGKRAWGDLPVEAPAILAPAAGAFLASVADDGVPIAVGLLLRVRRDLEGEGLAVREDGAAVQADTGNAEHGELDGEDVTRLAHGIIARCLVHAGHLAVGKRRRVKARGLFRVLIEPKADRVFGDGLVHGVFRCLAQDRRKRAGFRLGLCHRVGAYEL